MIKISVIIPVYNTQKYLRECLDSVLSQTINEIEIICIDDGSTDDSYNILLEYARNYDSIIVLHQENQGAGIARNKGIKQARGKYLCFLDPDDYYAHSFSLERLYDAAEENQAQVCGGNIMSLSTDGKRKSINVRFSQNRMILFKEYGDIYNFTRFIFKTEMIQQNGFLFPPYRRYQDPPFLLNVMARAGEFYAVDEQFYILRVGHRQLQCTLNISIDILKGIRDCFQVAWDNHLVTTYQRNLKNILCSYLVTFYQYANQGQEDVWDLINEINEICRKWIGDVAAGFNDKEGLDRYVLQLKSQRDNMIERCRMAHSVVIYGAGEAGMFFLERYGEICSHIEGFAVSEESKNESDIEGYPVKEITKYGKEALVIVAAGKKNADEILGNLETNGFKDICYVDYSVLRILEDLK